MKKRLILVLALVILTGCTGQKSSSVAVDSIQQGTIIPSITIDGKGLVFSVAASNLFVDSSGSCDQNAVNEWQDYINQTYNLNISLINIGIDASPEIVNKIKSSLYSGMACLSSNEILPLIQGEQILPLDEYLVDNKVWNSLPETFRKRFEYQGHIWAIPRMEDRNLLVSSIRTDWLKEAGLKTPTTLEKLKNVGQSLAKQDPNGDGDLTNDYLIGGAYDSCPDIWNALGIYFSESGDTITYDPTQGCIVDSMFKPEASDALQYFRDLYEKGLLPESFFMPYMPNNQSNSITLQAGVVQGKYMASFNWAFQNDENMTNKSISTLSDQQYKTITDIYEAMSPLSRTNPIVYTLDPSGYVLSDSTENPQDVVNAFVNLLFSKQGYLDCTLGIPSQYTQTSNNVYLCKYADEKTKTSFPKPGLVNAPTMIFGGSYAVVNNSDDVAIATRIIRESSSYENNYVNTYTASGQLACINVFNSTVQSATYEIQGRKFKQLFMGILSYIPEKDVPISSLVKSYRKQAQALLIDTILQEANENAGLTYKPTSNN